MRQNKHLSIFLCFLLITNCFTTSSTAYHQIPRLDEVAKFESVQVIKLSDTVIASSLRHEDLNRERMRVYSHEDLIEGMKGYIERYSAPMPRWEYANVDAYLTERNKAKPEHLKLVKNYFGKNKDPLVFTSHRNVQYSCCEIDWTDEKENLILSDFFGLYLTDSWSPYLFPIKYIPTDIEGIGIFSFQVDEDRVHFRANASKSIWRFQKYWTQVHIFSTSKGKDKFPLLMEISDPNDRGPNSQNGFYLILPKEKS